MPLEKLNNFKIRYIKYLVLFFILKVNAQVDIRPYEEIAVNYFAKEISKSYKQLNFIVFDGNLESISPLPYSFCMLLKKVDNYEETQTTKINVPYPLIKKLDFSNNLFISRKKVGVLYVFKNYPKEKNIVVVIYLTNKNIDDYYNILIDVNSKKVIDYCKKSYYR